MIFSFLWFRVAGLSLGVIILSYMQLPTSPEFILLYVSYGLLLLLILTNGLDGKNRRLATWNLIIFCVYFVAMLFAFSDPENFKYGNSLAMLFYGWMLVLVHFLVFMFLLVYRSVTNSRN